MEESTVLTSTMYYEGCMCHLITMQIVKAADANCSRSRSHSRWAEPPVCTLEALNTLLINNPGWSVIVKFCLMFCEGAGEGVHSAILVIVLKWFCFKSVILFLFCVPIFIFFFYFYFQYFNVNQRNWFLLFLLSVK